MTDESNSTRINRLSVERLKERFGDALTAPVRFWTCLNPDHQEVTWCGDVATCVTCGLTSDMTKGWFEDIAQLERARLALELRRASAGRAHYASGYPEDGPKRLVLEAEAHAFDQAARITEGDALLMCGILPSFMWGSAENDALRGGR